MKIQDSLIIRYYNLCTDVHPDEVARLQKMLDDGVNPRDVKMMLAHEITKLYAGAEAADQAEEHCIRRTSFRMMCPVWRLTGILIVSMGNRF